PFDVPVGLFALRLQVDAVGQPGVEEFDHPGTRTLRQAVLRVEHRKSPQVHVSHPSPFLSGTRGHEIRKNVSGECPNETHSKGEGRNGWKNGSETAKHFMSPAMSVTKSLTWFITGCSSGFGRQLAKVVLARGYRAVVTARNAEQVEDLVVGV